MLEINFFYFLCWLVTSIFFVLLLLLLSFSLSTKSYSLEKLTAYECGFDVFSDTKYSFDVHFFKIALLFLLFDLEIIFFFPLITCASTLPLSSFIITVTFIFIVCLGFFYE
jgi:NADH-quinone oxidoreductase subunit A